MAAQRLRSFAFLIAFGSSVGAAAPGAPAVVGFRVENGVPHVRVRGGASADIETKGDAKVVVLRIPGAKALRRIDRLPIETGAFGTLVQRIDVQNDAAGLVLRVRLSDAELPPIAAVPYAADGVSGIDVRFGEEAVLAE